MKQTEKKKWIQCKIMSKLDTSISNTIDQQKELHSLNKKNAVSLKMGTNSNVLFAQNLTWKIKQKRLSIKGYGMDNVTKC
jgi:hypothetical protein